MPYQTRLSAAIIDLYDGHPNQGMRCIRNIVTQFSDEHNVQVVSKEFELRGKQEIPDLSYDIYISTGGPGDPMEGLNSAWESKYFQLLKDIERFNKSAPERTKKKVLFICHSFQLACRYFSIAKVTKRKSTSFGVFPIHLQRNGKSDPVLAGLQDPFYAVDSRDYQVIQPDESALRKLGGHILAIEKERPHIPLERAVMAIRFNNDMIGTQFHPEADPVGMSMYLQQEEKKKTVIAEHGYEKWKSMLDQLNDPDKILFTYSHIIPNFLQMANKRLSEQNRSVALI